MQPARRPEGRPSARFAVALLLCLVGVTVAGSRGDALAQSAVPAFRIIVNPQNQAGGITRRFLAEAFLKKTTRWPSGEIIRPVDLGPDSPIRAHFTEEVLGRSVGAVKSYWQQLIFAGRDLPPPELESDAAVIRYVLHNNGAVGYISADSGAGANLGGARVVPIK